MSYHIFMKRIFYLTLVLVSVFGVGGRVLAAEVITDFSVQADLAANRMLTVTETIQYDFGTAERHGIFRNIPVEYDRDKGTYDLKLKFLSAKRDGQPEPYKVTQQYGFAEIKIGSPNRTITGPHVYVITYQTKRAVNDFSDHTELYWNVTGNDWEVPIQKASLTIHAPAIPTQTACYTGKFGETGQKCTATSTSQGAAFVSTGELGAGEGFTTVMSFAPGVIKPISAWEIRMNAIFKWLNEHVWELESAIVFIIMFIWWWKKGREPRGRGTVIAHYEEPQNLPPAMMAGLLEQRASTRAMTATILDLARRGYLKVIFGEPTGWISKKQEFSFKKLKEADDSPAGGLVEYEKTLFKGLFKSGDLVTMEDLKYSFHVPLADAREQLFTELKTRKLFGTNPSLVRMLWIGIAVAVAIVSFFLSGVSPGFASGGFLSAVIIAVFGWQMPRMTKQGAIVCEEIEGFKKFLSVTEKARLEFTDAPKKTPEEFARFLPAAVALGVEEKWSNQFKDMELLPPSYMQGPSNFAWNALAVSSLVNSFHTSAVASAYVSPSSKGGGGGHSGFSSGGGFSGGGFGGGGGGSW